MCSRKRLGQDRLYTQLPYPVLVSFFVLLFLYPKAVQAKPTSKEQAQKAVRGWLRSNAKPLGISMRRVIKEIQTYTDADGEAMYYIVYLQPEGYVVVPADDQVEPIIALAEKGTYDPSADNPLGALVSGDVPARFQQRLHITRHAVSLPEPIVRLR